MDNIQEFETEVSQADQTSIEQQMPDVQPDGATSEHESGDATTFDELKAKKGWQSPDDMAKAYANLESHSTKTSQEKASLEAMMFSKQQSQPQIGQEDPGALKELDKFVNERVQKEVGAIRAELSEKEARRELREVIEKNSDFGKYAESIKNIKGSNPNLSFNDAYLLAKAQSGDMSKEAVSNALQQKTGAERRQAAAQSSPVKPTRESSIGASDLLEGSSGRWKPNKMGGYSEQQIREIEQVEKEIFGRVLDKTPRGI